MPKPLVSWVWIIPLFSAVVWLAMLLALLLHWILSGSPHLPSMHDGQTIAYISNVGADNFKPLFIAMGTVSVVSFDLGLLLARWMRHAGHLLRNTSTGQKVLSAISIAFSIIGAAGLILLTIFDVWRHRQLHDAFLAVFIGGYVLSAVFICAEYWRLGVHFRQYRNLRISYWMKLGFILVEVALAIAFGSLNRTKNWNGAAVVEWVIALIYSVWIVSFIIDFLPSATPGHHDLGNETLDEAAISTSDMAHDVAHDDQANRYGRTFGQDGGARYPSGTSVSGRTSAGLINGEKESHSNGAVNGVANRTSNE